MAKKARGTWKIAYADFITALMVLFLTLWLVASISESDVQGVSEYFIDPTKSAKSALFFEKNKQKIGELENQDVISVKGLSEEQRGAIASIFQNLRDSHLQKEFPDNFCVYWHNGVVVEVFDSHGKFLFFSDTENLQPWAVKLMDNIGSKVVAYQKDYIAIEGNASSSSQNFDCWNLSFKRANAVRSRLAKYARKDQIIKVTGNGDKELLDKDRLHASDNSRISVIFLDKRFISKRQRSLPN